MFIQISGIQIKTSISRSVNIELYSQISCDSFARRKFCVRAYVIFNFPRFSTVPGCLGQQFSYLAMAYNLCSAAFNRQAEQPVWPASAFGSRAVWTWKFDCGYTSFWPGRIAHWASQRINQTLVAASRFSSPEIVGIQKCLELTSAVSSCELLGSRMVQTLGPKLSRRIYGLLMQQTFLLWRWHCSGKCW